jgi:insulysin
MQRQDGQGIATSNAIQRKHSKEGTSMRLPRPSLRQTAAALLFAGSLNAAHATTLGAPVIASPNDRHLYRAITLDNGLRATLIQDPGATIAAAALLVQAGSNQDPDDIPGLAHFFEHMLYLGSERYPEADGYRDFITRAGGGFNATTQENATVYHFSLPQQALPEALDRFGQLFSAPLLDATHIDRERHAVDAEYHLHLKDDHWRAHEASLQAMNPAYPATRFNIGNLETLKGDPTTLRQRLLEFRAQHYSADRMYLAISGPQSLDELQKLTEQRFSAIENRNLPAPTIEQPLFLKNQLPARLEVRSLSKTRLLTLLFPVPWRNDDYRYKPHSYILGVLGRRGPGSLDMRLRQEDLASNLSTSLKIMPRSSEALITVDINLSATGAAQQDRVQAAVFEFIELLRQQGLQDWRYAEQARLAEQNFRYKQGMAPLTLVRGVARNMSYTSLEDVVYASSRMDGLEPPRVNAILNAMNPGNLLRIYRSDEVHRAPLATRWFAAAYDLERVSNWKQEKAMTGLSLPRPNDYLANDFELLDVQMEKPRELIRQPGLNLWYQADSHFGAPKANWYVELQSPTAGKNVRERVLTEVLAAWWNSQMRNDLSYAGTAGLSGSLSASDNGMTLSLSGWRDKQPALLERMLDRLIRGEIDEQSFQRVRSSLARNLQNEGRGDLHATLIAGLNASLLPDWWLPGEKFTALESLKLADLRQFRERWLAQLHLQALAVGNLSEAQVQAVARQLDEDLNPDVARAAIHLKGFRQTSGVLPPIRPISYSRDAGALHYLPSDSDDAGVFLDTMLLGQLVKAPFINALRTDEQLGYAVTADNLFVRTSSGVFFAVQSHDSPSKQLASRIDAFIADTDRRIAQLDAATLEPFRLGVQRALEAKPNSLGELAQRNWESMKLGYFDFAQRERMIRLVATRRPDDLRKTWSRLRTQTPLQIVSDPGTPANIHQFTRTASTLAAPAQGTWQPPAPASPDDQATTEQL